MLRKLLMCENSDVIGNANVNKTPSHLETLFDLQ